MTTLPCACCRWTGIRISPERTGVFTSGRVWIVQGRRIALYFTGCKHAGENLAEVLRLRSPDLPPIIQMCDALSRNVPKLLETLVADCNAHYLDSGIIRSDCETGTAAEVGMG